MVRKVAALQIAMIEGVDDAGRRRGPSGPAHGAPGLRSDGGINVSLPISFRYHATKDLSFLAITVKVTLPLVAL
jgi:hypothetical protein